MKCVHRSFALLIFLLAIGLAPAAAQDGSAQPYNGDLSGPERILSFHSDVVINADSSIEVTETISCLVQGSQISRGILRDFPTRYKERSGRDMTVGFDVLSVRRNGASEPYKLEVIPRGKRIRIGDGDVYLEHGVHTYEIRYTTNRQIGFFEGHDELYWNVTGNGWTFSIDKASAYISLPERVAPDELKLSGYTGSFGSTAQNLVSEVIGNRQAYFETTAPLAPYEGLTIVAEFPKGLVREPTKREKLGYVMRDYRIAVTGAAGLLVVLLYYFVAWLGVGVDPRGRRGELLTGPPEQLSPAALGYIRRMGSDYPLMSAAIMSLGQKGALRVMQDEKGDYVILREDGDVRDKLSNDEWELLKALFRSGSTRLEIDQSNHSRISGAMQAFHAALARQCENVFFRRNTALTMSGCGLSLVVILVMGIVGGSLDSLMNVWSFVIWGGLIVLGIVFGHLMPAYTRRGRDMLDAIEGFRATLSGQGQYQETLREQFLPYAVALGVEKEWSKLLNAAIASGHVPAYQPTWYYGDDRYGDRNMFDTSRFVSDFSRDFSSNVSSSSSAPGSSSGGGGGGSSGGGGGGGGGSGW